MRFFVEKAAGDSRSQTLTRLAYKVVARQSVPPSGANIVAADLVTARLVFANGGRSGDLAVWLNSFLTQKSGKTGSAGLLNITS